MPPLRPTVAVLVVALLASALACASGARASDRDVRAALAAALSAIERPSGQGRNSATGRRPLVLVVGSATPPALRHASEALRPIVSDVDLPDLDRFALPPGHLEPQALEIRGDTAVFRGLLGPVPAPGTAGSSPACGHRYTVMLSRDRDGRWRVDGASDELC